MARAPRALAGTPRRVALILAGLLGTAASASAGCAFPGAVLREENPPRYFYANLAEAAGRLHDLEHWLRAAGDFHIWDVPLGNGTEIVCIEASTTATCSNGVATCLHALGTRDLTYFPLVAWAHQIAPYDALAGSWPMVDAVSQTYRGRIVRTYESVEAPDAYTRKYNQSRQYVLREEAVLPNVYTGALEETDG